MKSYARECTVRALPFRLVLREDAVVATFDTYCAALCQALKEAAKKAPAMEQEGDVPKIAVSKGSAHGDVAKLSRGAGAQGVQGAAGGVSEPVRGKASTRLVLPLCSSWWDELVAVPTDESGGVAGGAMDEGAMARARSEAEALYARELEAFAAGQVPALACAEHRDGCYIVRKCTVGDLRLARKHGSDARFVSRLSSKGTIKDRVAALTVQATARFARVAAIALIFLLNSASRGNRTSDAILPFRDARET
eukprot:6211447-Pleurochrysis_carterae.AAC.1